VLTSCRSSHSGGSSKFIIGSADNTGIPSDSNSRRGSRSGGSTPEQCVTMGLLVARDFSRLLTAVAEELVQGHNVAVHCLSGYHRGPLGVAALP